MGQVTDICKLDRCHDVYNEEKRERQLFLCPEAFHECEYGHKSYKVTYKSCMYCTREPRAKFTQKSHFTWTSTKEVEMVSAVSHPFQSVVISVSKV